LLFFAAILPILSSRPGFSFFTNYYQQVFINVFVSFVIGYFISSIAEALIKIKMFKLTWVNLLCAALLSLWYFLWELPRVLIFSLVLASGCDMIMSSCGYNTMSVPQLIQSAFERLNIPYILIVLYKLWFSTFIYCYFGLSALFTIAKALYGTLRKPKKTVPK
jgi:hypothetical protein